MTTIVTNHGEYTGRTVDSIVRREYGRKAEVRYNADPNNPHAGLIVKWVAKVNAWNVLANLRSIEK